MPSWQQRAHKSPTKSICLSLSYSEQCTPSTTETSSVLHYARKSQTTVYYKNCVFKAMGIPTIYAGRLTAMRLTTFMFWTNLLSITAIQKSPNDTLKPHIPLCPSQLKATQLTFTACHFLQIKCSWSKSADWTFLYTPWSVQVIKTSETEGSDVL